VIFGVPGVPIFPESETAFVYADASARLTFRLDAAGGVTVLILHQGGSDFEMRRVDRGQ
jgi:hypothetical protein